MPLVEFRKCPHCGAMTWHEMIDGGPPLPCYWQCRGCGERRSAKRIALGEDYALHRGRVQTENRAAQVQIVDISVHGARLRFAGKDAFALHRNETVLFNAGLQPIGPLGVFQRATVRWVDRTDFGIVFNTPLAACATDLSCVVKA